MLVVDLHQTYWNEITELVSIITLVSITSVALDLRQAITYEGHKQNKENAIITFQGGASLFVVHPFITYKSLYWFTEKIKDLFLCDTDYVSYCAIESEWIRSLWAGVCKIFFKNLFEDTLDLELCWKRDSTLGAFLPVLWIFT